MKHILLSLLMVGVIGLSFLGMGVSAEIKNNNEQNCEEIISPLSTFSNTIEKVNPGFFPNPTTTLDVKRLYLKHYFNGLTENFGYNAKGTCTFVAMGMLLSYYDSYLNDNIISADYDVASIGTGKDMIARNNSPGTLFDYISNTDAFEKYSKKVSNLNNQEYYNLLQNKYPDSSFQFSLIKFAKDNGFIEIKDDNSYIGLKYSYVAASFFELYLKSVKFEMGSDFTIDECSMVLGSSQSDVRQFIIDNINKGNPVYVTGSKQDLSSGHAFICYDYDDINNIYAHWGWHYNPLYHDDPFSTYPRQLQALAINFNCTHEHSYNYMVGNKAYCYCDEAIETYHNHEYTYVKVDKTNHRARCACGDSFLAVHWIRGSVSTTKCAACGAILDPNEPVIGIWSLGKTPNGSYISQNGIPVIMEGDVEAYLSGTLKFGSGLGNYDYI